MRELTLLAEFVSHCGAEAQCTSLVIRHWKFVICVFLCYDGSDGKQGFVVSTTVQLGLKYCYLANGQFICSMYVCNYHIRDLPIYLGCMVQEAGHSGQQRGTTSISDTTG